MYNLFVNFSRDRFYFLSTEEAQSAGEMTFNLVSQKLDNQLIVGIICQKACNVFKLRVNATRTRTLTIGVITSLLKPFYLLCSVYLAQGTCASSRLALELAGS